MFNNLYMCLFIMHQHTITKSKKSLSFWRKKKERKIWKTNFKKACKAINYSVLLEGSSSKSKLFAVMKSPGDFKKISFVPDLSQQYHFPCGLGPKRWLSANHLLQTLLKVWAQVHTWMGKKNNWGIMSITMASSMFLPVKVGFKNERKLSQTC